MKYQFIKISEKKLEEILRKRPDLIPNEEFRFVDRQVRTIRGPLDVLFADSGNSLVVVELKAEEDDKMLYQGIDYYDYIVNNIELFARVYKDKKINSTQPVRLLLIAPSFSSTLLNRCKWVDIPISLFTFQCITVDNNLVLIFQEMIIPSKPQPLEVHTVKVRLDYVTDNKVKKTVEELIKEIKEWDKENISIETTKSYVSLKVSGKVFGNLDLYRKHFWIRTYNVENIWTAFPIKQIEDLEQTKHILKSSYKRLKRT